MQKTISFLASGRGSNFENCVKKIIDGYIPAIPGILIVDKSEAKAQQIADKYGIKSFFIDPKLYSTREEHEKEMYGLLKKYNTDLIVAAGYMRIISPFLISKYKNQIINIHPALLPSFPGINAQKQAIAYGVKISGCTAHFIDTGVDTGPIIIQKSIEVLSNDTETSLSRKILELEHKALPLAVKLYCENKLFVEKRKVILK